MRTRIRFLEAKIPKCVNCVTRQNQPQQEYNPIQLFVSCKFLTLTYFFINNIFFIINSVSEAQGPETDTGSDPIGSAPAPDKKRAAPAPVTKLCHF